MREVDNDLRWLDKPDHHLIRFSDADYPALLAEIDDPPPLLFAAGQRHVLASIPRVAVVGARNASHYGLGQARTITEQLARHGVTVVSGLALGIDGAAHEGALAGDGVTVAVLGTGCDTVYPKRHWRLAERITRQGLLVSEFPTGVPGLPSNFPRRNRIVTGLCAATLVVEAAKKSGSLISARLALHQGREVMALPGMVTSARSSGCHQLIRDGALLVESSEDVLAALGYEAALNIRTVMTLNQVQQRLLECLDSGPHSVDMLCRELPMAIEELTINLVSLEVLGMVQNDTGLYVLAPGALDR